MIRKLLCWFGFHEMQEFVDVEASIIFHEDVTGSKCRYCGYEYDARTVSFGVVLKELKDDDKKARGD